MDMRSFAAAYLDAGVEIVPLLPGTKKIIDDGWQNKVYGLDSVQSDSNLGERCLNPVIDIDCLKALQCADDFLPKTLRIDGRPGKPRSHRSYVTDLRAEDFTDIDSTFSDQRMLVQILAGHGKQVVVPPSLHESGERRAWADGSIVGPPASPVDAQLLRSRTVYVAAVALIARHWPKKGIRRELRLAYARVLLETLNLEVHVATRILEWACKLGGSDENGIKHAARAVRDTRDALDKDGKAIGAAYIRSALPEGAALLRRLREWFGKTSEVEEAVEKLNDTYFLIDVGTETVVGEHVIQSDTTRQWTDLRVRPFADFKKKLVKHFIKVGTKKSKGGVETPIIKPLADVWLTHKAGAQFDRLVYAPEGSGIRVGPHDLNGWRGFTVQPAPGAWSLTRDTLIKQILCRDDVALFEFTLDWMADLFQRPGQHAETSLVLTGKQGTGKNVFGGFVLGRTFDGRHARVTTHTKQVLGEFNDILSGLCLLVLDEVGLNTPAEYSAVKGLITGHTIDINRKGIRIDTENSMLHVLFLSNHDVPLKVAADDRRFVFYNLADTYVNDTTFFGKVACELDERGGRAAMLHELLARHVQRDHLRLAPNTTPKQLAKRESWTPAQWFFFRMMRESGPNSWVNHTDRVNKPLRRLKKTDTTGEYQQYLAETNSRREVKDARSELHNELKKLVPKDWEFNRVVSEGGVLVRDYWTLPDWEAFTASFAQAVGCAIGELLAEELRPEERQMVLTPDEKHFADADEAPADVVDM